MRNTGITLAQAALWCNGTVAPQFAHLSFSGVHFDTRSLRAGQLFVAVIGARDGHDYAADALAKGAVAVLASKPLPPNVPAIYVADTVRAMQDIARCYRRTLSCRCVGVTGSVGKTTTKEMIAAVLQCGLRTAKTEGNFNNGMGLPLTVLDIAPDCQAAVLEMGMNHFGEIALLTRIAQPDIAVITNIGTAHIEYLGSQEGILRAKLEILEGLRQGGRLLVNGDDALLRRAAAEHNALTFGFGEGCAIRAEKLLTDAEGMRFEVSAFGQRFPVFLPLRGTHHITDALAAVGVGLLCGLTPPQIVEGLRGFRNTGMRQRIFELGGVTVIEDCYNAGPESMQAALRVLAEYDGRRIAVLGGMLELGDFAAEQHRKIGTAAAAAAELLFAYGTHSAEYVEAARASGIAYAEAFPTHEALADALRSILRQGDVLLIKGSRGMHMERISALLQNKS